MLARIRKALVAGAGAFGSVVLVASGNGVSLYNIGEGLGLGLVTAIVTYAVPNANVATVINRSVDL